MEIIAESGVGSDSSCHVPNKVKVQSAALGFRIKSGWAAVVLLTDATDLPSLRDSRVIDLCDPRFPDTRQPYHATFGQLETDAKKTNRRTDMVHRTTKQSITNLLADYRRKGYAITSACLVVGSQLDPATIANPHIRAHALEGQLFRLALEQALNAQNIRTDILVQREAYARAAAHLKKSVDEVCEMTQQFRRFTDGPWRAEQKLAALAAWFALWQDLRPRKVTV
jgi:hypothetical protein